MRFRQILTGSALFLCILSAAPGQATDGKIVGAALNASGAGVPNAKIELLNKATGVKTTATTDSAGSYRFGDRVAGTYKVTATAKTNTTGSTK